MKKILFILLLISSPLGRSGGAVAQTNVNYNDVAVIVNSNDTTSIAIGNYFKTKRNIPAKNIISVDVSPIEEINDSVFKSYRKQVEDFLINNNLIQDINYLVTTKGCPLKILRDTADPNNCNASVESELMMIIGKRNSKIGNCGNKFNQWAGAVGNPYLNSKNNFESYDAKDYQMYLVTRLDAYTQQEVFNIIDRSGPNILTNQDNVLFVFDGAPNWVGQPLLNDFSKISDTLIKRGWRVLFNKDSVYVTHQKNVIGYMSWGSNDGYAKHFTDNAKPYNSWANGSIVETGVSTGGRSFQPKTTYGQSLIADWLKEGATAAKGYVYEPFTNAIADPNILFNRYTDLDTNGYPKYNLAESYFAASGLLGWKDVVIGDPKTSIRIIPKDKYVGVNALQIADYKFQIFPNPSDGKFILEINKLQITDCRLQITNVLGQIIHQSVICNLQSVINLSSYPQGIYFLQLQNEKEIITKKIIVK